jgi:hypothetical protein
MLTDRSNVHIVAGVSASGWVDKVPNLAHTFAAVIAVGSPKDPKHNLLLMLAGLGLHLLAWILSL